MCFRKLVLLILLLRVCFGDESKDYFKILGVKRSASKEDIKKAYKQKSLKMHPDKIHTENTNEREAAEEKFSELNNAYEILMNDDKRQLYLEGGEDALKQGGNSGGNPFFHFHFGGNGFGNNNNNNNKKKSTLRQYSDNVVYVVIEEHEAYIGVQFNVSVIRRVKCPECHGAGKGSLVMVDCHICNGSGSSLNGTKCSKCNGKGKLPYSKCSRCRGGGSVTNYSVVPVYIPQGVCNDDELQFSNLGDEYIEVGRGIVGKGRLNIRIKIIPSFPASLERVLASFPSPPSTSCSPPSAFSSDPLSSPLFSPSSDSISLSVSPSSDDPQSSPSSSSTDPPSSSCSSPFALTFPTYTRNASHPLHVHTTLTVSLAESLSGGLFRLPFFDGRFLTINKTNTPLHDGEEILLRGQGIVLDTSEFASKSGRHMVSWKNKYGGKAKDWGDVVVTVRVTGAAGPPSV